MGMLLRKHYAKKRANGAANAVAPEKPANVENKAEKKATITAEEIKAMNGTKLRKLATENGIENPEELTVGELKAVLVEKLVG